MNEALSRAPPLELERATVLVSGASGFLGAHVVRALRARGAVVRAMVRRRAGREDLERDGVELVEANLLDERSLRAACAGADALVHCAAHKGLWSRVALEQRRVNVEGTAAILRAAHHCDLKRIVHVSTTGAIGGSREPETLDERSRWGLYEARVSYVATKHEAEQRALSAAWGGMPVVIVNPGALLGPRLFGGESSTVARARRGGWRWAPPGGASFCDVEDVAQGCLAALAHGGVGERYILGGHNLTWEQLQRGLAQTAGATTRTLRTPRAVLAPLRWGASALDLIGLSRPPWAPERFATWGWYVWVSSAKAERELGYRVRPLAETLARACATR